MPRRPAARAYSHTGWVGERPTIPRHLPRRHGEAELAQQTMVPPREPSVKPHLDRPGPRVVVARLATGIGLARPDGGCLGSAVGRYAKWTVLGAAATATSALRHVASRDSQTRRLLLGCLLVLLGQCVGAGAEAILELPKAKEAMRAVASANFTTMSSSSNRWFRTYRKVGKG
jgi:hypothetical protein